MLLFSVKIRVIVLVAFEATPVDRYRQHTQCTRKIQLWSSRNLNSFFLVRTLPVTVRCMRNVFAFIVKHLYKCLRARDRRR
jgi:hypothetical protein